MADLNLPTAEKSEQRYKNAANVVRRGKYTDKNGITHRIMHLQIIANNRSDAGLFTTGALLLLVDIDGKSVIIENPLFSIFVTPKYRKASSTDKDLSEYNILKRRLDEACKVVRVNDDKDEEQFDDAWWDEYAPLFGLEESASWNGKLSLYYRYGGKTNMKNGNIAVNVDRGNGIEGYRRVSRNDVEWVRNIDGRYVPRLKSYAKGGKSQVKKYEDGDKSLLPFAELFANGLKKVGEQVQSEEEDVNDQNVFNRMDKNLAENKKKVALNEPHSVARFSPRSFYDGGNLFLRLDGFFRGTYGRGLNEALHSNNDELWKFLRVYGNRNRIKVPEQLPGINSLESSNSISDELIKFLEDNNMQIGPNGLPVYTEGLNNLRNW